MASATSHRSLLDRIAAFAAKHRTELREFMSGDDILDGERYRHYHMMLSLYESFDKAVALSSAEIDCLFRFIAKRLDSFLSFLSVDSSIQDFESYAKTLNKIIYDVGETEFETRRCQQILHSAIQIHCHEEREAALWSERFYSALQQRFGAAEPEIIDTAVSPPVVPFNPLAKGDKTE